MTYKQAEEKIFDAYFKDEIKLLDPDFCFCGTLSGGNDKWSKIYYHENNPLPYSYEEYGRMEYALFSPFKKIEWLCNGDVENGYMDLEKLKSFEDKLFKGMCAALEVLKSIHRDRGEIIDGEPVFIKRTLLQNS